MNGRPFHRLIAIIFAMATAFNAVFGGGLVHCDDANGKSHLEWGGCDQEPAGLCTKSCGPVHPDDSHSSTPAPCDDKPVQAEVGTVSARSASSSITLDLPPPTLAVISFPTEPLSLDVSGLWIDVRAAAPPPAIVSIKTIVMLV